jgi:hypothetical protein
LSGKCEFGRMFRTEVSLKRISVVYTTTVETKNQKNDGFEADEPFQLHSSHAVLHVVSMMLLSFQTIFKEFSLHYLGCCFNIDN